jgi:hypothetical protein
MNKKIRKPWVNWVMVIISLGFFSLVVLRALKLSITHDEAYTYLHYVTKNWWSIIIYKPPHIPNNHILNTLLIKISCLLFGANSFSLRLPNVLFSLVYFYYAASIAKSFRFPGIQILAFLALCLQVYFFDFFALARGYGMGLALIIASIYHLYKYRELNNGHHIWRTLIFAAFAVYANFTFLYAFVALTMLLVIVWMQEGNGGTKTIGILLRPVLIVSGILFVFIAIPLKNISGDLFGGETSFWRDTVGSLTWNMQYGQHYDLSIGLSYLVAILILIGALFFVFDTFQNRVSKFRFYQDALLLLTLTATVQILQHLLLGTQFLMGRTALVYAPLFLVYIIFLFQRFNEFKAGENIQLVLNSLWVIILLINFKAINFSNTFEWQYDTYNKQALDIIEEDQNGGNQSVSSIGINWLFEPSLNFYRIAQDKQWLKPLSRDGYQEESYQYYYLLKEKDQQAIDAAEGKGWSLMSAFPNGAYLFKNNNY